MICRNARCLAPGLLGADGGAREGSPTLLDLNTYGDDSVPRVTGATKPPVSEWLSPR